MYLNISVEDKSCQAHHRFSKFYVFHLRFSHKPFRRKFIFFPGAAFLFILQIIVTTDYSRQIAPEPALNILSVPNRNFSRLLQGTFFPLRTGGIVDSPFLHHVGNHRTGFLLFAEATNGQLGRHTRCESLSGLSHYWQIHTLDVKFGTNEK